MQALGMIEVYGYLTAVEALDSALKAANVSLLDVVCVKGGLVTVLVTGDVGATKAAIDASAAAAERVGKLISVHVIARPANDIEKMLKPPSAPEPEPPTEPEPSAEPEPPTEPESSAEPEPTRTPIDPRMIDLDSLQNMTVSRLRALVRGIENHHMSSKEIRFAKKEELIAEIHRFCGQEG